MRDRDMTRMPRLLGAIGLMVIFLLAGVLVFSPAYAGPETIGPSPDGRMGVSAPQPVTGGVDAGTTVVDSGKTDAEALVMETNEPALPVGAREVNSSWPQAAQFRQKSGFDAFNAQYQNKWTAHFSRDTGLVNILYGARSRAYKNGPEAVARGFLRDTASLFGIRPDLSDLATKRVDRTPERDHVLLQQTYNGVPIAGAVVLVHATPRGQVTMVQNGYWQGFKPANEQVISGEAAAATAQADLLADLGKDAVFFDPRVEPLIAPYKGNYYYTWRITIPTQNPFGTWVFRIDAESGAILYKANEIHSLITGKGWAYKSNADWFLGKISNVNLPSMYTAKDKVANLNILAFGSLYGVHAQVHNSVPGTMEEGPDPFPVDHKFFYDPSGQLKPWFDETDAYYEINTIWSWWKSNVISRYYNNKNYPSSSPIPALFLTYAPLVFVNASAPSCACNAYYSSTVDGTNPGFAFGDEHTCLQLTDNPFDNEDLVIDNTVVRHEYTHYIMNLSGFDGDLGQFGGDVDNYGRAMGEGNADFFAFLNTPTDPYMGEVAWHNSSTGYLRDLDNTRMYPRDVDDPDYGVPEEHYTGQIWGGYLYDLYRVLKGGALPYVYHAFFYFNPSGGYRGLNPSGKMVADFFDGIQAQMTAEKDLTGGLSKTAQAWGSMASRGINAVLRIPYRNFLLFSGYPSNLSLYPNTFPLTTYYHPTDYFGTGAEGEDQRAAFYWSFPPSKSVKTKGNILSSGDWHEYPITVIVTTTKPRTLIVTVTAAAVNGVVNPNIYLYQEDGTPLAPPFLVTITPTTAVLNYPVVIPPVEPGKNYVIVVTGNNTAAARGYYDLTITLK